MSLPEGRRVVVTRFGETPLEAIERCVVVERQAAPEPAALGASDVVVRVRAAEVNWVDLLMASGLYQHVPSPPYTPGLGYAGEVVWTGAGAGPVAPGDRVIVDGLRAGPRSLGDYRRWGGWASYAVAPADALLPLPARLDFDQGAVLLGAYETAYHALVHRGHVGPGDRVLVLGASGTTGLAAVQVAKLLGATVIATGRSADKLSAARALGADHEVVTSGEAGGVRRFRDEVRALTAGEGVEVVWDGVGGDVSLEALRCVRFGARFLVVGWASTPFVAQSKGRGGAPRANTLPTNLIMMKGLDVLGCPAAITAHLDPEIRPERLARVLEWAREGAVAPPIGARYPLEEIRAAMRAKWEGAHAGACVVRPRS